MASIFISHSKYDTDKVNYFAKIFARLKLKASFMELEDLNGKYAGFRISDIIRSNVVEDTNAVIVLLGKNLENPPTLTPEYTHNWVNFEVGVSAGCRKPVWVFEDYAEYIQFPIPYVTDYCRYNAEDVNHLRVIGDILESLYNDNKIVNPPQKIKCNMCSAEYNFWNEDVDLNCPVCRRTTTNIPGITRTK